LNYSNGLKIRVRTISVFLLNLLIIATGTLDSSPIEFGACENTYFKYYNQTEVILLS